MPKTIEGKLVAKGMKFGIVASRFNDFISGRLVDGAVDALTRAGADEKDIQIYKVPGAFELPLMAKKLAKTERFDAVICLGAVIRGATPHFEYISAEVTKGIAKYSQVRAIYDITGDMDFVCVCYFKNQEELDKFLKNQLQLPFIERVLTNVVLNTYKDERRSILPD